MKKTIIGIAFLSWGILTELTLVGIATSYLPHLTAWSTSYPSKLMFLIFAGKSEFSDGADGLGLGLFFLLGGFLVALGIFMLLREYLPRKQS